MSKITHKFDCLGKNGDWVSVEFEEGDTCGYWVRHNGERVKSLVDRAHAIRHYKEIPIKPVYPRYFANKKDGYPWETTAYVEFSDSNTGYCILKDGSRGEGTWQTANEAVKSWREITREEAEKLVKKPEPKVRYFVPIKPEFFDHYRVVGDNDTYCVKKDGTETYTNDTITFFSLWDKVKEVFPESSDSLRRSHRYAAKYNEGKAAGKKEAQAEIDELKNQCQSSYKQGRDAGAHEVESYRKSNDQYAKAFAAVEKEKAALKQEVKQWQDSYYKSAAAQKTLKQRLEAAQEALTEESSVPWLARP